MDDRITKMVKNYPKNFVTTAVNMTMEGVYFMVCITIPFMAWISTPFILGLLTYFTPLGFEIGFGIGMFVAFPIAVIAFFACINQGERLQTETKRGMPMKEDVKE